MTSYTDDDSQSPYVNVVPPQADGATYFEIGEKVRAHVACPFCSDLFVVEGFVKSLDNGTMGFSLSPDDNLALHVRIEHKVRMTDTTTALP